MKKYVSKGKKYGRLTAVCLDHVKNYQEYWTFLCECGNRKIICAASVAWSTKSCGCIRWGIKKYSKKTPEYRTWCMMNCRCFNVNDPAYKSYGGRGITVCGRWKEGDGIRTGFQCFIEDMGPRPKGLSLDRIDNNKGYEKSNCQWSSPRDQARNRRSSHLITFDGQTKTLMEWSEIYNIKNGTLWRRLKIGWSPKKALTHKVRGRK